MNISKIVSTAAAFSVIAGIAHAAALVTITIDTGSRVLQNQNGVALPGGTQATGDGAVVQVGYYQGATVGNNFGTAGSQFIPLIGLNSDFGLTTLTIGDQSANGAGNGTLFSDEYNLALGTNGGVNDSKFPTAGTPLTIRVFNATTLAGSTFSESISNNLWLWQDPRNPPLNPTINLNFDDGTLVARSGQSVISGSSIRTASPVPEPTSMILISLAGISFCSTRSRR